LNIPILDIRRGGVMTSAFICVYLRLKENSGSMAKTVNGCENARLKNGLEFRWMFVFTGDRQYPVISAHTTVSVESKYTYTNASSIPCMLHEPMQYEKTSTPRSV